ncbi:hypothetical protein AVDCRST_MAG94-6707, partial [uncultured Leptolyngbya sp.]
SQTESNLLAFILHPSLLILQFPPDRVGRFGIEEW